RTVRSTSELATTLPKDVVSPFSSIAGAAVCSTRNPCLSFSISLCELLSIIAFYVGARHEYCEKIAIFIEKKVAVRGKSPALQPPVVPKNHNFHHYNDHA